MRKTEFQTMAVQTMQKNGDPSFFALNATELLFEKKYETSDLRKNFFEAKTGGLSFLRRMIQQFLLVLKNGSKFLLLHNIQFWLFRDSL